MISERDIADGFHSFWSERLPFLTPDFIRVFNGTCAKPLLGGGKRPVGTLPIVDEVRHHDIVAEVAFYLARYVFEAEMSVNDGMRSEALRSQAVGRARDVLLVVHKGSDDDFVLTAFEWLEVQKLLLRYLLFLHGEQQAGRKIGFEPTFPGLGFVAACRGDLSAGKVLYEVKTVVRGLQSRDFKQIFVYFALQEATGDRRWDVGGFLNPRRGLVYRFHVEQLVSELSGGKTAMELFAEIADFFCSRDVQLDRSF